MHLHKRIKIMTSNGNCTTHLHFPQCLAAGGGGGRLAPSGSEKDIVLLPVVVTCQELLLFGMKQSHHITLGNKNIHFEGSKSSGTTPDCSSLLFM